MSTRPVLWAVPVLLAGALAACDEAEAPSYDGPVPAPLADRLDRADAAFEGTVLAMQTVMSEPDAEGEAMPHTIVTYRVDRPLKSAERGETLNLRFVGGPLPDGRVLSAADVPRFAVGDRDVLFVANNGASWCPLVDCAFGRLRVIDGRVHDVRGLPVLLEPPAAADAPALRVLPSGDIEEEAPVYLGVPAAELVAALAPLGSGGSLAGLDVDPTASFPHPR